MAMILIVMAGFISCGLFKSSVQSIVEGLEGGTVTLPCSIMSGADLYWNKLPLSGNSIIIGRIGTTVPHASSPWSGDVDIVGDSNLLIRRLRKPRDEGDFQCRTSDGTVAVTIVVPVTAVEISEAVDGKISVSSGQSIYLTCTVKGNPSPAPNNFAWTINGASVADSQTFALEAMQNMNGETIMCVVKNYFTNGTVLGSADSSAVLDVTYLDPVQVAESITVTENGSATLQCSAEGNPQPSYQWMRSGNSVSSSADYVIHNAQRSAAGVYTCYASANDQSEEGNTELIIQYPPDIALTYNTNSYILSCTAHGVPDNYTFSQWEQWFDGELIRSVRGVLSNHKTLTLATMTYDDMGHYMCMVANGIESKQKTEILVIPETPAVWDYHQEHSYTFDEGSSTDISVSFFSHPDFLSIDWNKPGNGTFLHNHTEQHGIVTLALHNITVSVQGHASTLTLTNVSKSHEGQYIVAVTNVVNGEPQTSEFEVLVNVTNIDGTDKNLWTDDRPDIVIGVVVGVLASLAIAVVVSLAWYRRIRHSKSPQTDASEPSYGDPIILNHEPCSNPGKVYEELVQAVPDHDYQNLPSEQTYEQLELGTSNDAYEDVCDYEKPAGSSMPAGK